MNTYNNVFLSQAKGGNREDAYAKVFGGIAVGGLRDAGKDVLTGDDRVPYVQIKGSLRGLQSFLAESLRRRNFIPICVGEPGQKEEMIVSLLKNGVWVGSDIPDRQRINQAVAQVRYLCTA